MSQGALKLKGLRCTCASPLLVMSGSNGVLHRTSRQNLGPPPLDPLVWTGLFMQHYFCVHPTISTHSHNGVNPAITTGKSWVHVSFSTLWAHLQVFPVEDLSDDNDRVFHGSIFFRKAVLRLSLPSRPCTAAILNFNVNFFLKKCVSCDIFRLGCFVKFGRVWRSCTLFCGCFTNSHREYSMCAQFPLSRRDI